MKIPIKLKSNIITYSRNTRLFDRNLRMYIVGIVYIKVFFGYSLVFYVMTQDDNRYISVHYSPAIYDFILD